MAIRFTKPWLSAPDAAVIIPPRATAVLSDTAETTPRDRHIQTIAGKGRLGRQKAVGDGKRSLVEVAMLRYKTFRRCCLRLAQAHNNFVSARTLQQNHRGGAGPGAG